MADCPEFVEPEPEDDWAAELEEHARRGSQSWRWYFDDEPDSEYVPTRRTETIDPGTFL